MQYRVTRFDRWVNRLRPVWAWVLLTPLALFLAVFFVIPLLMVVQMSVTQPGPGIGNYLSFFSDKFYLRIMAHTFWTALLVALWCLMLGYPVAYVAARYKGWLGTALLLVVGMSFWTSFLVRTYAWMVILGNRGPVAWLSGILGIDPAPRVLFTGLASNIGMIHILLPFMIMVLYSVMTKIDESKMRAAASLGATPFHAFRTVYLPLSYPGVINGFMLIYIVCLGFYVTPELLGGPRDQMIARQIGAQIEETISWGGAATMSVVLLIITLALYAIYDRLFGIDRLWR